MLPVPLHPAIVHFPIALGVLLPFALLWGFWRARKASGIEPWAPALLLALLLAVSSSVAAETGENEEDRVEPIVTEQVLEEHEEAGELLQRSSIVVLLVFALGLVPRLPERVATGLRIAALIGSAVLIVFVYRVGHSGGALVYEHGAAAAYLTEATSPPPAQPGNTSDFDSDDE